MRRALSHLLVPILLGLLAAGPAAAQQNQGSASVRPAQAPNPVGAYAGVTPGTGNLPPRAPGAAAGRTLVTWPGFQARPDGASRFFVQTNGPVTYETLSEDGRVVILVRNVGIHLRNNRRALQTQYFNSPVTRARLERRGSDVAIVLTLRAQGVSPRVSSEAGQGGYHFVLIEFAAGDYLPADMRPPEPTVQAAPQRPPPMPRREPRQAPPASAEGRGSGNGGASGSVNIGFGN